MKQETDWFGIEECSTTLPPLIDATTDSHQAKAAQKAESLAKKLNRIVGNN